MGGFVIAWQTKENAFTNSDIDPDVAKFLSFALWPLVVLYRSIKFIFKLGASLFYKIDNKVEAHKLNKKTTYRD